MTAWNLIEGAASVAVAAPVERRMTTVPVEHQRDWAEYPGKGRRVAVLAVHHVDGEGRPHAGGAEKYILLAIRALLRSGACMHVGYSGKSIYERLLEEAEPDRLTVERTDWLDARLRGDRWSRLALLTERRRWLKASRADTVFAIQQDCGASFAVSLLAARSLGLRVVSSIRQMPPTDRPPRLPEVSRWAAVLRRRWSASCCDAIIFNSRRVCDAYARIYGYSRDRLHVIHNGTSVVERAPSPHPNDTLTIATAGRLTEAKGVDEVLSVFAKLAARFPHLHLVYFGDGPLRSLLARRADALGLSHRVHFSGYQPEGEALLEEVDIYLQLSHRESMSNSVMEAMARGIPCIVTDVGGLPEMIEEGVSGLIVRPGDVDGCSRAVERLLTDSALRRRMGTAAWERARRLFDPCEFEARTVRTILGVQKHAPSSALALCSG